MKAYIINNAARLKGIMQNFLKGGGDPAEHGADLEAKRVLTK